MKAVGAGRRTERPTTNTIKSMSNNVESNGNRRTVDWQRFGLGGDDDGEITVASFRQRSNNNTGGFVDLGNEYTYAAGGHHASGANEIFAGEQGDKPWCVHKYINESTLN